MKKRQAKKILIDLYGRKTQQVNQAAKVLRRTCKTYEISVTFYRFYNYLGGIFGAFNNLYLVVGFVDEVTFLTIVLRRRK